MSVKARRHVPFSLRLRFFFSWLVLGAGAIWGFAANPEVALAARFQEGLFAGYVCWSLYWGVPPIFRWWLRQRLGPSPIAWLFKVSLGFCLVPILGYLYGFWGGGIYECVKSWWKTRS